MDITRLTRIGELLEAYPELEDVLIATAPASRKLRNPVLRRTVAGIATVEKAAGIADIPIPALVEKLRQAVGLNHGALAGDGDASVAVTTAPPGWVDRARIDEMIDADAMLGAGQVPLGPIVRHARVLQGSAILLVVSTFRPAALADQLLEIGMRCHIHTAGPEKYETFIMQGGPEPASTGSA